MAAFNTAFASARKAGKSTFTWNGKKYTTKLASSPKAPKNVPVPTPRPKTATTLKSTPAKAKPVQGPQAPKQVGIARPNSVIGRAAARSANAPKPSTKGTAQVADGRAASMRAAVAAQKVTRDSQGPKPEGVWYARKGSAMSTAAARRANAPTSTKKPKGGGW